MLYFKSYSNSMKELCDDGIIYLKWNAWNEMKYLLR